MNSTAKALCLVGFTVLAFTTLVALTPRGRLCHTIPVSPHNQSAWVHELWNRSRRAPYEPPHRSRLNEPFSRTSRDEDPTSTSNWPGSVTQSFFAVL
jgi:hypothetical protein